MNRLNQLTLIVSFVAFSWLAMQVVHELGHVWGAYATGGNVEKVVLYPTVVSRTDVYPNPRPLIVVWAGPIIGSLVPLLVLLIAWLFKSPGLFMFRFFAGFCLVANGYYIGLGSFHSVGDAGDMLFLGSPQWCLILYGLASALLGFWVWNGIAVNFGIGKNPQPVNRAAVLASLTLLFALVALELIFGNAE